MRSVLGLAVVAFCAVGGAALLAADDRTKALEAFKAADLDGDGVLSAEEFVRQSAPGATGGLVQTPAGVANTRGFKRVPPPPEEKPKDDALSASVAKYLDIHKSFLSGLDKDATDPAKFTWTKPEGKESTYTLDFAVQLDSDHRIEPKFPVAFAGYNWLPSLNAIFEAHVSTISASAKNQLLYQGSLELHGSSRQETTFEPVSTSKGVVLPPTPAQDERFFQAHHLYIRPGYETDRHSSLKQARLDLDYTPDLNLPFYGANRPLNELRFFGFFPAGWEFYWRPVIGVELHSVEDGFDQITTKAHLPGLEEEYGFLRLHLQAELRMFDRFSVTATWQHRTEIAGNAGSHNYLELAAIWTLDPDRHYSVGASYKRGEDSPTFEDLNLYEAWVGFDF